MRRLIRRFEFRRRVPGRAWWRILWYDVGEAACHLVCALLYRVRIEGMERIPSAGPVIFVSNHQSFIDPVLNGMAVVDRQMTSIARDTLFRNRFFGRLIGSFGAIGIREDGGDAGAMRTALAELAAGRCVLIYPEGSRSEDGTLQQFKRGVGLLIKRAKVPVLPMALDGSHDIWPRHRRFPRLRGRIGVRVGELIPVEEFLRDGIQAGLERMRHEIETLRLGLRGELRRRSDGRWPTPGPDDRAYWEAGNSGEAEKAVPESSAESAAQRRTRLRGAGAGEDARYDPPRRVDDPDADPPRS